LELDPVPGQEIEMHERDADLKRLIDAVHAALKVAAPAGSPIVGMTTRFFDATEDEVGARSEHSASGALPVCEHLEMALDNAAVGSMETKAVTDAFAVVAPRLTWRERVKGPNDPNNFSGHHANATLIGIDGLELRDDIRLGVSLVAPGVTYPDHEHPPEEIYLVLSEGEWRNAEIEWHAPGIGGCVHNPPGIVHAMRSGKAPLFAIWCLVAE